MENRGTNISWDNNEDDYGGEIISGINNS